MRSVSPAQAAAPRTAAVNLKVLAAGAAVVLPLLAVLALNLGRDPRAVRSPLVGQPAPPFSLPSTGGGAPLALESLRGHPVVVNFWATWCVPCIEEQAALTAAARSLQDARFVGIVYEDEAAAVGQFLASRPAGYPTLMDPGGRTAIAYGVAGVPETFFLDAEGRVVEKHVGPLARSTIASLVARARGAR